MTEYIERAAVCKACKASGSVCTGRDCEIPYVPAADVAPVRHGRWHLAEDAVFRCSECGRICYELDAPYCYCGALMREVGNGEK
jgi:hypothetical protein